MITEIDNRADMMPNILQSKYSNLWAIYESRLVDKPIDDWKRDFGYYIPRLRFKGHDRWKTTKAKVDDTDRKGIFKIIDYEFKSNPNDMVDWSTWEFVGFENEKPIRDCGFLEFKNIYGHLFNV